MVATFLPTVVLSCAVGIIAVYCIAKQTEKTRNVSPYYAYPRPTPQTPNEPHTQSQDERRPPTDAIEVSMVENVCYAGVGTAEQ